MMPSWFEEIQRRKRGMQGPVPPDLMSGATPPFNPDAGSPLPQPWEMDPAVRGMAMPQPPARPARPVEEEIGAPPQMGAQQAMSQRVQDLEAARERQRTMPGWRKALGGVLEGIGSGRRGGLGGIARVGGGALTGRNAVQEIEQDLPAYDRAADNERAMNSQAENLAFRRQQLRALQNERERTEEARQRDDAASAEAFTLKPGLEEIGPNQPYDPARHASKPIKKMINGEERWYAPVREDVRADSKQATIPLSAAARKKFPELPERLPAAQAAQYERLAVEKQTTPATAVVKTPDGVFVLDKATNEAKKVPGLRGTPSPRDPDATANRRGTRKQFADLDAVKSRELQALERERRRREADLDPMPADELRDRKQQIQDTYEQKIQTLGGEASHFDYPSGEAAPKPKAATPTPGLPGQQPQRPGATPRQKRRVRVKLADGQVGTIDESEFDPDTMTLLQ